MLRGRWARYLLAISGLMVPAMGWSAEPTLRSVGGLSLRVDADLEIEPVASSDLIKWPIVADWDGQGRLVVAECGGVAKPIAEHNKQLLHRIVRLVDTNGDGKFDKRVVAADKLAFPEGVLCIGNSILVSAPPEIWKLTDADNDGVCEQREVWFNPGTITGCANDLHGPYLGRDGWIYWCKGAFAEQKHELINGRQLTTKAAHIFRRRFEGGAIEPVMTGGMDNPVEMAMSHSGERFFTSTFLQHPGDGRRDGIAHAIYGGVYGKQHDVLLGHARTGELMPIMTHLGPAAPSGLICLEQDRLLGKPTAGIDTLVAAQFNLHKITAHELVPNGADFTTKDRELVGSERIDFHPTDVIESPDGSLLVLDTGGWYNLCCPSSHVDQSIATGGIYRLTSATTRQTAAKPMTNWQAVASDQAAAIVKDSQASLRDRQQALWRLCRIAGDATDSHRSAAEAALADTLTVSEALLRQQAAHSLSVQRVQSARPQLQSALMAEKDPAAARAMAEALGRLGSSESVPLLLGKLGMAEGDRMLEHSLIYALIELNAPQALMASLESKDNRVARAAMIAIDQAGVSDEAFMKRVWSLLTSQDKALVQSSADILARHKEWAGNNAFDFNQLWSASEKDEQVSAASAQVLAAWFGEAKVAQSLAERIDSVAKSSGGNQAEKVTSLLSVISGIKNQAVPSSWTPGLLQLLGSSTDEAQRLRMASWLSNMKLDEAQGKSVAESLEALVVKANEDSVKLKLLSALRPGTQLSHADQEQLVVDHFLGGKGVESVHDAGRALARLRLTSATSSAIVQQLDKVQPLEMMQAISAISAVSDDALDMQMLDKLVTLPAARTLAFDQLTSLYRSRSDALKTKLRGAVETLSKPPADVEAKLDELLGKLKSGDAARGFQVFRGTKAACSACHRIGYVGGTIGPELTRIGATRSRRALLEAIVFPNARLEQSYTPVRILTSDGLVLNGLIARETGDQIELVTGANQRVTIAASDIEQRLPSQVSIMPAGLEQQLSLDDLADLLTLLESAGR